MWRNRLAPSILILFLLWFGAFPAQAGPDSGSWIEAETGAATMSTQPAGWYPIYRTGGQAARIVVDGPRDRILVAARYWGLANDTNISGSTESANLLLLERSGALLHNISLSGDSIAVADFDVDSSTGLAYVSLLNGTILQIDTASGRIANYWGYGIRLSTILAQAGELYVAPCCQTGRILRVSAETGAILQDIYIAGQGDAMSIAVDPAGRWLFTTLSAPLVGDLYQVDLVTGRSGRIGSGNMVLLSADGRRVWFCGWGPLSWYWLSNDTWAESTIGCADRISENPVTGVIAFASGGRFVDETGEVGSFHFQDNVEGYPWQALDADWTADGHALAAIAFSLSEVHVGLWDGDPWLNTTRQALVNPTRDPICYPLVTAGGIDEATVVIFRDGIEIARGTPDMTQACFGTWTEPSVPLEDGLHEGRIVGFDRVGRPLDANVTFETDGTPPRITITSPLLTQTTPYVLSGTVDELHLARVSVSGTPASVSNNRWSAPVDLWIGDNWLFVGAEDTVGNEYGETVIVRYWPSFQDNVTHEREHFQVSTPPGWTGGLEYRTNGVVFAAALFAPREGTYVYNTSVTIRVVPRPGLAGTQAEAYEEATDGGEEVARYAVSRPSLIGNTTVDGHPATRLRAEVGSSIIGTNTTRAVLYQTYVVAGEWDRLYVISFNVSWMQLDYASTEEWVLESFQIEETQAPAGASLTLAVILSFLIVTAGIGGVAAVLLARRRAQRPRPPPEGGDDGSFP